MSKSEKHIMPSHYVIWFIMWIFDFAHYVFLFLPNLDICVLDSELPRSSRILRVIDIYWLYAFCHGQRISSLRRFSAHTLLLQQCLASVQLQIHIPLQLVFYWFFITIDTFKRNQLVIVTTVVNTMLVLKKFCLSTRFHILWYYFFMLELQWSNTSQGFRYLMTLLPD